MFDLKADKGRNSERPTSWAIMFATRKNALILITTTNELVDQLYSPKLAG